MNVVFVEWEAEIIYCFSLLELNVLPAAGLFKKIYKTKHGNMFGFL